MTEIKPIRVLQINSGSKNFGGVSSFLYNIYTHIDKEKIQFDFLSPNITTYGIHRTEIEKQGGKIFELHISGNVIERKIKLYYKLKGFLKQHPYTIVHINSGNFFFNLFCAKASRKAKTRNIYIHSHSIENPQTMHMKKVTTALLRISLRNCATRMLACSVEAARYMFGEKAVSRTVIVRNGIDIERFSFNQVERERVRKELSFTDKHVVGHVGRFTKPKNHPYIINVFAELTKRDNKAVLLLVGEGEDKQKIIEQIHKKNLSDKVVLLGTKKDIERYYQAMDVFLFPSNWEGLGMVLIEAQISGLPCIASTRVPKEATITENVQFLDIQEHDIDTWVSETLKMFSWERKDHAEEAFECGYSNRLVATRLMELYSDDSKRN